MTQRAEHHHTLHGPTRLHTACCCFTTPQSSLALFSGDDHRPHRACMQCPRCSMVHALHDRYCTSQARCVHFWYKPNMRVSCSSVDNWRKEQGDLQNDAHDSPRRRNLPPPARESLGPCPFGLESGKCLDAWCANQAAASSTLTVQQKAGCNTHVR